MFGNHLIQFGTSERVRESFDSVRGFRACSRIIYFSSGLQSVFATHLIQLGTSERVRESFTSVRDFRVFATHLIQFGTSEHVRDSFDSVRGFRSFFCIYVFKINNTRL